MKKSLRFHWNAADTLAFFQQAKAWNVLIPYIIVIIPVLIDQIPKDWAYAAIVIYALQRALLALKLFVQGK